MVLAAVGSAANAQRSGGCSDLDVLSDAGRLDQIFEGIAASVSPPLERPTSQTGNEAPETETALDASSRQAAAPCIVFVSASSGARADVAMGRGLSIAEASKKAGVRLRQARENPESPVTWLQLDVVDDEGSFDDERLNVLPRGVFGLTTEGLGAYLLPGEILANRVVDSKGRYREDRYREFVRLFENRAPAGDVEWHSWFTTRSFFRERDEVVRELYRGQAREITITAPSLRRAASAAGSYLARSVRSDGSFEYEYLPKSDRMSEEYNLLRHAGSIYSMLELYGESGDSHLLQAAERATSWLLERSLPCGRLGEGLCPVEDDEVKLGGNGLAVLALLEHPEVARRDRWRNAAQALGERILAVLSEDGAFWPHKVYWSSGVASDFRSEYYPGEAIYALSALHRMTGQEQWLTAARRAADHRVGQYLEQIAEDEELPHDHWFAYGLAELAEMAPAARDMEYLRHLASAIVRVQHRGDGAGLPPDWSGGFYTPPRAAPTATRAEALGAILRASSQYEVDGPSPALPPGERRAIEQALCASLRFQLRAQFTPSRALYLPDPERVLGGVSRSLTDFSVRIDYAQHSLSSFLAAAGLIESGGLRCEREEDLGVN